MKNSQKLLSILCHPNKKNFSCICIKWFKSAKKDTKNVKLKLLTREDTFGLRLLELDFANWAQTFDKCDPEKQIYRHKLMPNTEFQLCRRFVRNDLVERKIKSCRKSLKNF